MKTLILAVLAFAIPPRAVLGASTDVVQSTATVRRPRKEPKDIVWPDPPERPRVQFVRSLRTIYDLKGVKPGFWSKLAAFFSGASTTRPIALTPFGIAVRGDDLYLTDTGEKKVVRIDLARKTIQEIPGFEAPVGVTSDPSGNIYVADSRDNSVSAYDPQGRQRWKTDDMGTAAGALKRPAAVAWTPAGELLVNDAANNRVVVLSKDGKFLRSMCHNREHEEGALTTPTNLWVEPDGNFIVTDPLLGRVHVFTSSGAFVTGFGELGDSAGFMARPRGVASDSDGNIYVADALFNRVQIFNRKGELELYFGGPGIAWGKFTMPAGMAIDEKDRIYVVDSGNSRVEILQYIKYTDEHQAPEVVPSTSTATAK